MRNSLGWREQPVWLRYGIAILFVACATVVRTAFQPFFAETYPFITFFPAVILVALYAGPGPGLLAVGLSALAADDWIIASGGRLRTSPSQVYAMVIFVATNILVVWTCERTRRATLGAARTEAQKERVDWRNRMLEALTTGVPLNDILDLLCLSVEAEDRSVRCSVQLVDRERKHLLHASAPSLPYFYNKQVDGIEIAEGVGACGTAAYKGQRVIVEDILTHPYWAKYQELARMADLRAVWSEPVFGSGGQLLGTFAMYYREPRSPSADEIQLIQYAAGLASVAIERRRAQEAILEARAAAELANQTKDQFLAVLSHELRTPLTPVLATVTAMETEEHLSADLQLEVSIIRRNVEMEAKLIDDLLDVTRISRGKIELYREPVDVHDCLRATLEMCLSDIKSKHIQVSLAFEASVYGVLADPTRLRQVFWNLLNNAVKFTPAQGQIALRTFNEGERLKIEIADTGVGIDPEALPRIFNAFEQGEQSKRRKFGGLGLGLCIAKTIVEMHGGVLRACSGGKNKGAVFTVELAALSIVPAANQPAQAPPKGVDKARRILLVDDHPDTLHTLAFILNKWGYAVETADSVQSALELAAKKSFDILVSDLGLPDGSGLEIMRQTKHLYGLHGCALSGYGMDEDIRQSHAAGFDAHLIKPVSFQALRSELQRLALQAA